MLSRTKTIDDMKKEIETFDTIWGYDYDNANSYQEVPLASSVGSDASGLSASTKYYFKVNTVEYDITTAAALTYKDIIDLMNVEVSNTDGNGFWIRMVGNSMRVQNDKTGGNAAVALAAGTTGTDLFVTLADWSAFSTAIVGNTARDSFEWQLDYSVQQAKDEEILPLVGSTTYTTVKALDGIFTDEQDDYKHLYLAEVYFGLSKYLDKWARDETEKLNATAKDVRQDDTILGKERASGMYEEKALHNLYLGGWKASITATRDRGIYEK